MDLIEQLNDRRENLLPMDGCVFYFGSILTQTEADTVLQELLTNIEWKNDQAVMYGKRYITKRKIAWYGDKEYSYTYSRTTKYALPWTPTLLDLKILVEGETQEIYNSCLLNLYHSGEEGMAWHRDEERELVENGPIASLSFGAARKFAFKHIKTGQQISKVLEHGSLLLMQGETQTHWQHSLPKSAKVDQPRINLTFRCMREVRI